MALSRSQNTELKFHRRQLGVLTRRIDKMTTTAQKKLADRLAETQADLQATQSRIAELEANA